jgi:hypothetical protein
MHTAPPTPKRRRRWYNPISIIKSIYLRPRVYLGAAVGIALLLLMPRSISEPVRETTAWCLGAATYLILAFRLMRSCHADRIRLRAGIHDDSGILILGLILLAIFSSFSAIFGLLSEAKAASSHAKMLFVGLAAATIFISMPGINRLDFPKDLDGDAGGFRDPLCASVPPLLPGGKSRPCQFFPQKQAPTLLATSATSQ